MKHKRKMLIDAFRVFLNYDNTNNLNFRDPWDDSVNKRVDIDCDQLANIAISIILDDSKDKKHNGKEQ